MTHRYEMEALEYPPLKLWQTQLKFAVFCASSACGVSSEHLSYKKHSMAILLKL